MDLNKLTKFTRKINGWLTNKEGFLLYNLAQKCPPKVVIVEIGSWLGKSTIWLGWGSKNGNKVQVHAIDPHTGIAKLNIDNTFPMFTKNIAAAGLSDIVVPVVKTSEVAVKTFEKPIGLIFIDGNHQYEMVKTDFSIWHPKLIPGGIMAFHDTNGQRKGPTKLMQEILSSRPDFQILKKSDSITAIVKNN